MKLFFSIALILSLTFSNAQENQEVKTKDSISNTNYEKIHELRLGALKLLAASFVDISYEYINTPNTGLGASLYVNLDDVVLNEKFGIMPYYRFYFGRNEEFKGRGFFVEGFVYAYQGENQAYFNRNNDLIVDENFFDIAPGFALGSKWINSSGFVFQIKLGVGRNILGNNQEFDAVATGDFYFGYRF